jgi:hypothetical protein
MNKIFYSFFTIIFFGLLILLTPREILAAQLIFKVAPTTNDGATIVEAYFNPEAKKINVVEGVISFQGAAVNDLSVGVETGGSVLTMWPTPPNYLANDKVIRFVGGVPQGFDKEGLLFRMRLTSTSSSSVSVLWSGGMSYLNDGQGTKENISARSVTVNLDSKDSDAAVAPLVDNTPPTFVSVETGRDANTYDGKYFISINATDDSSGVKKYEIKEGKNVTDITDGVYVLKNQDRKTPVTVTAYDQAGNSKTIEIPARFNPTKNATIIILIIIIIFSVGFFYAYKKIIKK